MSYNRIVSEEGEPQDADGAELITPTQRRLWYAAGPIAVGASLALLAVAAFFMQVMPIYGFAFAFAASVPFGTWVAYRICKGFGPEPGGEEEPTKDRGRPTFGANVNPRWPT